MNLIKQWAMILSDRIRFVGVNDFRTRLFEHQWPLPFGVSYNSYLVIGEKVALIDTAAASFKDEFLTNIKDEIGDRKVDYLVVNHMEPDHSALQAAVRAEYPECTIVTNAKAVPMIEGYQGLTENILTVKEGETLDLGGISLQFFMVPMVHWPETMVTWCPEENTLFSGDAFGSFRAVKDYVNDSESGTFTPSRNSGAWKSSGYAAPMVLYGRIRSARSWDCMTGSANMRFPTESAWHTVRCTAILKKPPRHWQKPWNPEVFLVSCTI